MKELFRILAKNYINVFNPDILKPLKSKSQKGSGHFSGVYAVQWETETVALKLLQKPLNLFRKDSMREMNQILKEIMKLKFLRSQYFLDFYGVYVNQPNKSDYSELEIGFVMEHMDYNLNEYIQKLPKICFHDNDLIIKQKKKLIRQILKGIIYLHSKSYFEFGSKA